MRAPLRRLAAALVLLALPALAQPAAAPPAAAPLEPAALVADPAPLRVSIAGHPYALNALVLRRPGTDRLPVALITHGALPAAPRSIPIDSLRGWADEFAQRGWLAVAVMRRGYGASEGEAAADSGSCAAPDVGRYLDTAADDLEAALDTIAERPDADMTRVVAVGHSVGGAAVLDLAARPRHKLRAVVNVAGGVGPGRPGPFRTPPGCELYGADLVWNLARFGALAHMPTLWLYAENDSYFSPGLVARMRAAFRGSGGSAELSMLPPYGTDGHKIFTDVSGRQLVLPILDAFLRAHDLPTWSEQALAPTLAALSADDAADARFFLRALPTEKALVAAPDGTLFWSYGRRSPDEARRRALDVCRERTGAECRLLLQDFQPFQPSTAAGPPDASRTAESRTP